MKTKPKAIVLYTLISFSQGAKPEHVLNYLQSLEPTTLVRVDAPGVMLSTATHSAAEAADVARIALLDSQRRFNVQNSFIW